MKDFMRFMNGGRNRIRTCDHYLVEVVLYQLSYATIVGQNYNG